MDLPLLTLRFTALTLRIFIFLMMGLASPFTQTFAQTTDEVLKKTANTNSTPSPNAAAQEKTFQTLDRQEKIGRAHV